MKKILISIIVIIILVLIGYFGYQKYYQKDQTVDTLLEQQTKDIQRDNENLEKIIKETDFNPETATPQEVIDKLDKLEDID